MQTFRASSHRCGGASPRAQRRTTGLPLLLLLAVGCSGVDGSVGTGGTGGQASVTGGAPGGGAPGVGGILASGGLPGASGGEPSSGGGSGSGGSSGSGGGPIHPTCPGGAADAYDGAPAMIPGTIEAEDFDPEGYSDSTPGNEGTVYRPEGDVDIKDLGDGWVVGWMTTDEWLEFTVDVPTEGDFDVVLRAGATESGRTLELSQCGTSLSGPITIPTVADWGELSETSPVSVHLMAGVQVLRLTVTGPNDVDLDSLSFSPASAGSGGAGGAGGAGGSGGIASGGASGGTAGDGGSAGTAGTGGKFVGNITTGWRADMDVGGRVFSDYWDQVSPENAGKWGSVQGSATSGFNWSTLDALYDYAQSHGIIFKQHVFIWGSQQPSGNITEAHVKEWMNQFCDRYPKTKLIEVVNEPPPHTTPAYANAIGGGTNGSWQWIINAFNWAREACPDAILILNDYNNVEWADQNQHFIDIANTVKAAGAPIDALGAQSHGLSEGVSTQIMKTLMTKLHQDTGLPVYVTEYDINLSDDNAQLGKFQEHIPFFMETEWIHGVTLWGWIYGSTWVTHSGLIRDGAPRPAMTWLMDYLDRPAP